MEGSRLTRNLRDSFGLRGANTRTFGGHLRRFLIPERHTGVRDNGYVTGTSEVVSFGMDSIRRERSSSSFGLFREEIIDRNGRRKIGKFRLSFGVVAVCLFVITIVFFTILVNRSTKIESIENAKRLVNYRGSTSRKTRENVSIIPEARQYPNHRYEDRVDDARTSTVEESKARMGNRNNIQDIIHRIEMKEKLRKLEEKSLPRKPILFKGVYVKKTGGEDERDTEYFREINEMIEGDHRVSQKKKAQKVYSDRASPFRLRNEAEEVPRKTARNPITVMLDIYPVMKPQLGDVTKAVESVITEPVANAGRMVTYTLVPLKRGLAAKMPDKGKLTLKLNLYPKNLRRIRPGAAEVTSDRFRRKLHRHGFWLLGRDPQNKPPGGKWNDENGDPTKFSYVTLKFGHRGRRG